MSFTLILAGCWKRISRFKRELWLPSLHGGKPSAQPLGKYNGPLLTSPAQQFGCTRGAWLSMCVWREQWPFPSELPRVQGVRYSATNNGENSGGFLNSDLRICGAFYPKYPYPALWQPQEQYLSPSDFSENQHHWRVQGLIFIWYTYLWITVISSFALFS